MSENKIKNKRTGAEGKNTTKNGKKIETEWCNIINDMIYEKEIISDFYNKKHKYQVYNVKIDNKNYIRTQQSSFKKYEEKCKYSKKNINKLHGTKNADDCLFDIERKKMFWFECKYQNKGGSVVEKLQTSITKSGNLKKRFPDFEINYIYILSTWFKTNAKAELEYLQEEKIPFFYLNDKNLKEKILFLLNKL